MSKEDAILSEIGDGRLVKMEVDYSDAVDKAIPEAEKLAQVLFFTYSFLRSFTSFVRKINLLLNLFLVEPASKRFRFTVRFRKTIAIGKFLQFSKHSG